LTTLLFLCFWIRHSNTAVILSAHEVYVTVFLESLILDNSPSLCQREHFFSRVISYTIFQDSPISFTGLWIMPWCGERED